MIDASLKSIENMDNKSTDNNNNNNNNDKDNTKKKSRMNQERTSWPLPRSFFSHFRYFRQGPKPWIIICDDCKKNYNIIKHVRRRSTTEFVKNHGIRMKHSLSLSNDSTTIDSNNNINNDRIEKIKWKIQERSSLKQLPLKKRFSFNFRSITKYYGSNNDNNNGSSVISHGGVSMINNSKSNHNHNANHNQTIEVITID